MSQLPPGVPADSVRALLRAIFASPAYAWSAHRSFALYLRAAWAWLNDAIARLAERHPFGFLAVLVALTLVAFLLLAHIGFVLWRALRPPRRVAPGDPAPPAAPDGAWYLREAARLAAQGRYREALAFRFVALLRALEARRAVTVRPAVTPAEYAREARLDPAGRSALDALVTTLYAVVFGGRRCDATTFADFDRAAVALLQRAQAL